MRLLKSIPGFPVLVKKILELGYEKFQYGVNMASAIQLRYLVMMEENRRGEDAEHYLGQIDAELLHKKGENMYALLIDNS